MRVTAILPVYGRSEQTLALIPRLLSTAGIDSKEWELVCVCNGDPQLAEQLKQISGIRILASRANVGYWKALREGTVRSTAPLIVNLANDLLPGYHWLSRALIAFDATYKDGEGQIGFNDSIRLDQSAHFLISRSLLEKWYGKDYWPIQYSHSYGDSEVCDRAKAEGKYAIAPFAILYHQHIYTGLPDDEVYKLGRQSMGTDKELYEMRKANQWVVKPQPSVS